VPVVALNRSPGFARSANAVDGRNILGAQRLVAAASMVYGLPGARMMTHAEHDVFSTLYAIPGIALGDALPASRAMYCEMPYAGTPYRRTMMSDVNLRHDAEMQLIRDIAASGRDRPVTMLNLNFYSPAAGFPDGELYNTYMDVLTRFLPAVGARILWRHPVFGQATGEQKLHEILAAWYPSHQAFVDLPDAPGAQENFSLRGRAVECAVIHRLAGDVYPLAPQ
jgi:hypothetical protein